MYTYSYKYIERCSTAGTIKMRRKQRRQLSDSRELHKQGAGDARSKQMWQRNLCQRQEQVRKWREIETAATAHRM